MFAKIKEKILRLCGAKIHRYVYLLPIEIKAMDVDSNWPQEKDVEKLASLLKVTHDCDIRYTYKRTENNSKMLVTGNVVIDYDIFIEFIFNKKIKDEAFMKVAGDTLELFKSFTYMPANVRLFLKTADKPHDKN